MEKKINIDIERLLRTKSWSQLNADDVLQVKELLSTAQEYEAMRALVLELRSAAQSDDSILPSEDVRRNLLEAFEDEQRKRRALWWNGLLISLKDKLRFDIPAMRYGVSGAFALLLLFVAFRVFTSGEAQTDAIVKSEPTPVVNPSQDMDSSEKEIQFAVKADSSPIENSAPTVQEKNLTPSVTSQPPANSLATATVKSPDIDTTSIEPVVAVNSGIDSLNNIVAAGSNTNAFITSGSATVLTNNATAPINLTWSNATYTDAGTSSIVGTAVYNLGPEKTRSLASDAGLIRTYYSLR
jgi:hypothetical protein